MALPGFAAPVETIGGTAGGRAVITAFGLSQGATEIVVSMGSENAIYHITVDA